MKRKIGTDATGSGAQPQLMTSPRLEISLLGTWSVNFSGKALTFVNRKCRALIAYLAICDASEQTRERLVGGLWSDATEERARGSLRQAIYEIRSTLTAAGFDGLTVDKHAVSLDQKRLSVDLSDVIEAAKAGRAHELLLRRDQIFEGLLQDLETVDPEFRVWLCAKRQAIASRVAQQLEGALRVATPETNAGESIARALLNLDPTHEEAARHLISARAAAGDIGSALSIYKTLWDMLDRDYGVEPSKPTQDLIAAVKLASPADGRAPETLAEADTSLSATQPKATILRAGATRDGVFSLTVGDFNGSGVEPNQHYLVQGFRRELIAMLVNFREWAVTDQAALDVARPVQRYWVEADVFRDKDGLRMIVLLRDAAERRYLWSGRYRLSVESWFETQSVLVQRIASALNVYISAGRMASLEHRSPGDVTVFDMWLKAQSHFYTYEPLGWHRASELFREIIAATPDFAPAYASLAQLHNNWHLVHPGVDRDVARTEEALSCAQTATRLDPTDSRALLSLAWSEAMAGRYDQAMLHFLSAPELNECDQWTLTSASLGSAFCGDRDIARALVEKSNSLPVPPTRPNRAYHATINFLDEDYAGCVTAATDAQGIIPNIPAWKASALAHLGRGHEAKKALGEFYDGIRPRWFSKMPPTDENIVSWFLQLFPIQNVRDHARLADGLLMSGAPVRAGKARH